MKICVERQPSKRLDIGCKGDNNNKWLDEEKMLCMRCNMNTLYELVTETINSVMLKRNGIYQGSHEYVASNEI